MSPAFRLRDLSLGLRLGLSCALLVTLWGFVASGMHLESHHENRDKRPGLSVTDVAGAYHGAELRAPLRTALERGHPADLLAPDDERLLAPEDRAFLLEWLAGERVAEGYGDIDLGAFTPQELLEISCLACHSAAAPEAERAAPRLDDWTAVKEVAFTTEVFPMDEKILLMSTHTHALSLGSVALVLIALLLCTAAPEWLKGLLAFASGFGLAADMAGWWLAREHASMVWLILGGGVVYMAASGLIMLAILAELWRPRRSG